MAYLLDANIFMQAKNLHYGFDFCPAFWEWLLARNEASVVFSIEKVGTEIAQGNDTLSVWAAQRDDRFFLPPDVKVAQALATVSEWANRQNFTASALNVFLQAADFYLIAHALAHSHIVVTHELPSPSLNKIKIPTVCIGLGIKCMSPFEMLRTDKARFVLGS